MTLTCQAEEIVSCLGGLNGSHCRIEGANPYIIHRHLHLYLRRLSAGLCVSSSMFGPTVTKYLNLLHFKTEKGVSGPMRPKGPVLGVVITNLLWSSVSAIRKY